MTKEKFYKKMWFIVLLLIFIPPVGLILMWVFKKPTGTAPRIILTVLFGIWCLGWFGSFGKDNSEAVNTDTKLQVEAVAPATDEADVQEVKQEEQKEVIPEESEQEPETEDDFSDVPMEYELTAGYYTAGIDIPAGKCNVIAVEGTGNLSSSNMFSGGVNEMFGIDDGTGFYTESFNGLKLPEKATLSTNGGLVIKLEYTTIESRPTGRTYDESAAIELSNGNYTAGSDFPEGIYNIEAVSGSGNLSSSNIFDGGVNEMFGVDDGSGFYNDKIQNITLSEGVELTVSGGLAVKLIPSK